MYNVLFPSTKASVHTLNLNVKGAAECAHTQSLVIVAIWGTRTHILVDDNTIAGLPDK